MSTTSSETVSYFCDDIICKSLLSFCEIEVKILAILHQYEVLEKVVNALNKTLSFQQDSAPAHAVKAIQNW